MKLLNGKELAGYIKERQAKQARALRQADGVKPKLAIVVTIDNPVTNSYLLKKQQYGEDILVDVDVHRPSEEELRPLLKRLGTEDSVHGIIVQLPLLHPEETEEIVNLVPGHKDVDGLGQNPDFEPATPLAILWLLSGYNVDLAGKRVLLVGRGRLVGAPLEKMLQAAGIEPVVADIKTKDLKAETLEADVIISATGAPGLIKADMIKQGAVIVDAGVADAGGKTVGDVAADVYETRDDVTITPTKGGVGPMTVCALFDNVLRAARASVTNGEK
jgi:methylenetetrahydrofolate dehydrogenase (NADP+)/methenyltetrahydrofolate cyclohydrolase